MGIAEQNMCSWAAGLARRSYRPFLHTFSVFLYRRILDPAGDERGLPQPAGGLCGLCPRHHHPRGVTHSPSTIWACCARAHMAIFDIGDATEIEGVLKLAYDYNGPVFIRMLRKGIAPPVPHQ